MELEKKHELEESFFFVDLSSCSLSCLFLNLGVSFFTKSGGVKRSLFVACKLSLRCNCGEMDGRERANSRFEICNAPRYTPMAKQVRERDRDTSASHSEAGTEWNKARNKVERKRCHISLRWPTSALCSRVGEREVQAEIDKVGLVHANSASQVQGTVLFHYRTFTHFET